MLPQTDKIDPRGIKNRAETAQGAPRSAHERQRAPQERPRAAQERPKSAPRASQERPRAPQEHPRAPQEPLKSVQRRPRQPSGHHFEASGSKKAAFEGDLSRDSVEKRVGNDFRSIFASCAQARTCEQHIKTVGFYWFFACPRLRARRENRPKIVPNALLDRVARRIAFESRFFELRSLKMVPRGLSGASLGALERLLGRSWALLGGTWAALGHFLTFLDDLDSILDPPRVDFGASRCRF